MAEYIYIDDMRFSLAEFLARQLSRHLGRCQRLHRA